MARWLCALALLFTGCTTAVQIAGPYAGSLSRADIQQIRRLAMSSAHVGHAVVRLDAIQRDEVIVESREYDVANHWSGVRMHVIHDEPRWRIDHRYREESIADQPVIVN